MVVVEGFENFIELHEFRGPCGCFMQSVRRAVTDEWVVVGGGQCAAHRPKVLVASEGDLLDVLNEGRK